MPSEVMVMTFGKLKEELCDGAAIRLPYAAKPFVVETEARIHGVGPVLHQREWDEESNTLGYCQAHNAAESNNSTYDPEPLSLVIACAPFRFYLMVLDFTIRTEHPAPSSVSNSALSSALRVAKWLLALQPFRLTLNHITVEWPFVADKQARIPWPVAMHTAGEIVQLAGELELDSEAEHEWDSDLEQEAEEIFLDDRLPHGEVVLLGIEMLR